MFQIRSITLGTFLTQNGTFALKKGHILVFLKKCVGGGGGTVPPVPRPLSAVAWEDSLS